MDGMNEVWLKIAQERAQAQLNAMEADRATRAQRTEVRRAWLSQQTGRALRAAGTRLITIGKRLECGEVAPLQTKPKAA